MKRKARSNVNLRVKHGPFPHHGIRGVVGQVRRGHLIARPGAVAVSDIPGADGREPRKGHDISLIMEVGRVLDAVDVPVPLSSLALQIVQ